MISQADSALYYGKSTTRDTVHSYQQLVEQGLVPAVKAPATPSIELF